MMNSLMLALCIVNALLIIYAKWLKKKVNQLTKENFENEQILLQRLAQIKALERRQKIEENNRHNDINLDERLRTKGYL